MKAGGHFGGTFFFFPPHFIFFTKQINKQTNKKALEEPDALVDDMRKFFLKQAKLKSKL